MGVMVLSMALVSLLAQRQTPIFWTPRTNLPQHLNSHGDDDIAPLTSRVNSLNTI